ALAGAVVAEQAHGLTGLDPQVEVPHRPEVADGPAAARAQRLHERALGQPVALADAVQLDGRKGSGGSGHSRSTKRRSWRRWTSAATTRRATAAAIATAADRVGSAPPSAAQRARPTTPVSGLASRRPAQRPSRSDG